MKPALTLGYCLESVAFLEPAGERPSATRRRNEAAVADNDRVVTVTVTLTTTGEQNRTRGRVDL